MKKLLSRSKLGQYIVTIIAPLALYTVFFLFIKNQIGDGFITYIDQTILIRKANFFDTFLTLWNKNNLGYISSIDIPLTFSGRLLSFFLHVIFDDISLISLITYGTISATTYLCSLFAFYKIQIYVFKNNSLYFPALTAIFYAHNFSMMTNVGVSDSNFLIISLGPLLLYILIFNLLDKGDRPHFFIEVMILSIMLGNLPFAFGYLLTLYLPYFILTIRVKFKELFLRYLILIPLLSVISSYFIYSYFFAYKSIVGGEFYISDNVGSSYIFLNNGIRGLFQLIYDWTIQIYYAPSNPHPFYHFFLSTFGMVTAYTIWLLVLHSIIRNWKSIKKHLLLHFLLLATIISFLFIKGVQDPFKQFNSALYGMTSLLQIIRTPSSKFSLPIMLYMSVLILISLNLTKQKVVIVIFTILIFLQTFLYFNPIRYLGYKDQYSSQSTAYIEKEYKEVDKLLNADSQGYVYLHPGNQSGYFNINNHKFISQDILGKILKLPVIHSDDRTMTNAKSFLNVIPEDFNPTILGNLSIRYIILRHDFDARELSSLSDIRTAEKKILNWRVYKKIFSGEKITVYRLPDEYFVPIVSIVKNKFNIGVDYQSTLPNTYVFELVLPNSENLLLNFNNSYNDDWDLISTDKSVLIRKLSKTNAFGNRWTIKILDSNSNFKKVNFELRFKHDKSLRAFFSISMISSIISLGFSAFLLKRN